MDDHVKKVLEIYTRSEIKDPSDKEGFHQWLVDEERAQQKEDALFDLWNETPNIPGDDTIESLNQLFTKSQELQKKKEKKFVVWKYAAAIALLISVGSFCYWAAKPQADPRFIEYFAQAGEVSSLTLPDGTRISANSGTVILYPESFGKDNRTLYISGEANFKVVHNAELPFVVKSKDFSVTALGTEFDVSAYPADMYYTATLINGSIKVNRDHVSGDIILKVSDQFAYNKTTGRYSIKEVNLYDATSWQRGEFVFRASTMPDILEALQKKYAISFQYKSNLFNDDKYNFRFKKESTLTDMMDIIKAVAGINYEKTGDVVYLTSRKLK
ncbi:MAG: DUF4974 domain-containing protein [Bacteroides sp.]|nr:DUF4974 domain-containing protein [Bacteroides sp.]